MKRNPMIGDIITIGKSPIEVMVVDIQLNMMTDLVFVYTVVNFDQYQMMPSDNHKVYKITCGHKEVIGPTETPLISLNFIKNVKFKLTANGYKFTKVNK